MYMLLVYNKTFQRNHTYAIKKKCNEFFNEFFNTMLTLKAFSILYMSLYFLLSSSNLFFIWKELQTKITPVIRIYCKEQ